MMKHINYYIFVRANNNTSVNICYSCTDLSFISLSENSAKYYRQTV